MFDHSRGIVRPYIRKGVGTAERTYQETVALGEIPCSGSSGKHSHKAPVAVLAMSGRYALADNAASGVPSGVNHLRAGIRLLVIVGHGHGIELRGGIVPLQYGARIFPGYGGAGLDLGPGQMGSLVAYSPLGHEVENASAALGITRIPVLHGAVLDIGILHDHDFHHCGVKLVLVAHRGRAAFHIADVRAFVGHNQCPLELARALGVDTEIGGEFHRAAYPLRDVAE